MSKAEKTSEHARRRPAVQRRLPSRHGFGAVLRVFQHPGGEPPIAASSSAISTRGRAVARRWRAGSAAGGAHPREASGRAAAGGGQEERGLGALPGLALIRRAPPPPRRSPGLAEPEPAARPGGSAGKNVANTRPSTPPDAGAGVAQAQGHNRPLSPGAPSAQRLVPRRDREQPAISMASRAFSATSRRPTRTATRPPGTARGRLRGRGRPARRRARRAEQVRRRRSCPAVSITSGRVGSLRVKASRRRVSPARLSAASPMSARTRRSRSPPPASPCRA